MMIIMGKIADPYSVFLISHGISGAWINKVKSTMLKIIACAVYQPGTVVGIANAMPTPPRSPPHIMTF